jgi:hypothetical protein
MSSVKPQTDDGLPGRIWRFNSRPAAQKALQRLCQSPFVKQVIVFRLLFFGTLGAPLGVSGFSHKLI